MPPRTSSADLKSIREGEAPAEHRAINGWLTHPHTDQGFLTLKPVQ